MAITFPTSPTTGQAYTVGDITWTYDGAKWKGQSVTATNIAGGDAGTLPYQSAANVTAQLAAGTSGYILKSTGAGAPVWGNDLAAKASLTGVETLTNKTLTSPIVLAPVITNGLINGPVSELFVGIGTGFAGYTYYAATNSSIQYIPASSTANGAINLTYSAGATLNSILASGQTMTLTLIVSNGATAYYPTSIQVDGATSGVTTRWSGGTAPTSGNANSRDVYTFTIVKWSSATFDVFASVTKFA